MDHFERLGLPRRFSVDAAAIEREYLARSRAVHPDFHQLGTVGEQRASLELTAALNEANLTLRDPIRRAEYLLTLYGGPTGLQEKSLDQMFLMEMMDVREQLEAAKAQTDETALAALETNLSARNAVQIEHIAKLFERYEQLPVDHSDRPGLLVQVRRVLNAVKTVRSLLRDLSLD